MPSMPGIWLRERNTAMIQERDEYQIYFTRDNIREAAGGYIREGGKWKFRPAKLTDEQCDSIAEQIAGIFDDEFRSNVDAAKGE